MFLERIESIGLAHYSYFLADGYDAIVIDPRRDAETYVQIAIGRGLRIRYVIETHRNEDYVTGSSELAAMTGATVWHADSQWSYQYGQPVSDGQVWEIGNYRLKAVHAPGHTPGMMNYVLSEQGGSPIMVFTGDTLFAGDVGRVDLLGPDHVQKMADMLYDTLFNKLLPLGDGTIVCPAHGSGSVCGGAIATRPWTTIGIEKKMNPVLQVINKSEFIARVAHEMERPPYFSRVEELNVQGPPVIKRLPAPEPLNPDDFQVRQEGSLVLDVRDISCYSTAHIPGALSMWAGGIGKFAGWFLPYDRPVMFVGSEGNVRETVVGLVRMGFDSFAGFLADGMISWMKAGKPVAATGTVTVQGLCERVKDGSPGWTLDVRSRSELETSGKVPGAHHIHLTQLPQRMNEVECSEPVYIFCGSGKRSMIAASILENSGWNNVNVVLGGFSGWASAGCPIQKQ